MNRYFSFVTTMALASASTFAEAAPISWQVVPEDDPAVRRVATPTNPVSGGLRSGPMAIDPSSDPALRRSSPTVGTGARSAPTNVVPTAGTQFNPYKDLNTVQGWNNAFSQYGVANQSSPYYGVAYRGQSYSDANGNYLQRQDLGPVARIGSTTYIRARQDNVNGIPVYTYIRRP